MAIANYISNANHLLPHGSTPGETKEPRRNGKLLVFLSSPPGGGGEGELFCFENDFA